VNEPIAVLGAGNGGQAMTADLLDRGYPVNLWNRSPETIERIRQREGIVSQGLIAGRFMPNLLTSDMSHCVREARLLMVTLPAFGHVDVARALASHLSDHQLVVLNPGRTAGAFEFRRTIRDIQPASRALIAEAQTILYACRSFEDGTVRIYARKQRVALAALPAADTQRVLEVVQPISPEFFAAGDVLETGFGNVGAVFHPFPTLVNLGWIESPHTEFKYYYKGITPTVAGFLEKLDEERIAVGGAYGTAVPSAAEWLRSAYGVTGENLYECIHHNLSYREIDAPRSIYHRYLLEDVPTGLVPLASFRAHADVPTPNIDLVIDLACRVLRMDLRESGRTIQSLGLERLSVSDLAEHIRGHR
jgi:opine dehydrogenase